MLLLAGKAATLELAKEMASEARANGTALQKFRALVQAQGGDVRQVDDPNLLPQAQYVEPAVCAAVRVAIAAMDTGAIGWSAVHLGAGRLVKTDQIDHAVGFILPCAVGDIFQQGDTIGAIHANDTAKLEKARAELLAALTWSAEPVPPLPHVLRHN